jgi:hypothetical protein
MVYVIEKDAEFPRLGSTSVVAASKTIQRWRKPPSDAVKINSDGSFLVETGEGGWGYVTRDGEGVVICAGAGNLTRRTDALQAGSASVLAWGQSSCRARYGKG